MLHNNMRKITRNDKKIFYYPVSLIVSSLAVLFLLAGSVYADDLEKTEIPSVIGIGNIGELITKVSGLTIPFAVLGFIASVIYAGFVRMTALGNPEKEAKSMKIAIAAAVGFAIIALAPLLVTLLGNFLDIEETLIS